MVYLRVGNEGLSERSVGAELEGAALHEGAVGEHHLVPVPGGVARYGTHVRTHGALALHCLAEGEQLCSV